MRDTHSAILLLTNAAVDHLRGLAAVLVAEKVIYTASTVARSAIEAAAHAGHLLRPSLKAESRVITYFNWRLSGLKEQLILLQGSSVEQDQERADALSTLELMEGRILESAAAFGYSVSARKGKDPVRGGPAYIGDEPYPRVMELVDLAFAHVDPGVGRLAYRSLSSVAHSHFHGLSAYLQFEDEIGGGLPDSLTMGRTGDASEAARALAPALVITYNVAGGLFEYMGWRRDELENAAYQALAVWSRVAGYPPPPPR